MTGSRTTPTPPASLAVTTLLMAWGEGDESALQRLIPIVHAELHRLARRQMSRERQDHTLQTSALVNEAYLRLIDLSQVQWQNRIHFFRMSARLMRRILVDHVRSRGSLKRGAAEEKAPFDEALFVSDEPSIDLVALDDALKALELVDKRKSQVIEMRFFGGLSMAETAEALQVSTETVKRDWRLAKLWLLRELDRT
jgi:RNA polymerase sigma factor (TIGR02999 family)